MESKIYKYQLNHNVIDTPQIVLAPKGSTFISTGVQHDLLITWTKFDVKNAGNLVDYPVIVAYTGVSFNLPKGFTFVGTEQIGSLVYHIFVGPPTAKKARK